MKTINVAELKAHLSAYLRLAQGGERIVVMDRKTPLAELGLVAEQGSSPWDALARAGLLRRGSQDWKTLSVKALRKRVPLAKLLAAVRDDER